MQRSPLSPGAVEAARRTYDLAFWGMASVAVVMVGAGFGWLFARDAFGPYAPWILIVAMGVGVVLAYVRGQALERIEAAESDQGGDHAS